MQTLTEILVQRGWAGRVLSQAQLARVLDGSAQRRYNLVHRALKAGELLQLRRGCYVVAPVLGNGLPHTFVLAQSLQPGSYVSFESALSFHGWIPESVPVTLSVTPGRRRQEVNHAVLGLYRFVPLALRQGGLLAAVDRHTFGGQAALIAQPIRALLDLLCLRKQPLVGLAAITRPLRIDPDLLGQVPSEAWQAVERVYAHKRMVAGIQALRRELAAS